MCPQNHNPSQSVAHSGFFILRTPLLPVGDLLSWGADLQAPGLVDDETRLHKAVERDRSLLRSRLKELLDRPEVSEAIFVASPSLHSSLDHWRQNQDDERGQKIERALVRYFIRMTTRPTPFGLFSGCSLGEIDGTTDLAIEPSSRYRRHTRPDMEYIFRLCYDLGTDRQLRKLLHYFPNPSIYRAGGRIRYVESTITQEGNKHHLIAVDETDYLKSTLLRAKEGAPLGDLAGALASEISDVAQDEAEAFVDELVETQILVADLMPVLTGQEPLNHLIEQLDRHDHIDAPVAILKKFREKLRAIDGNRLGNPVSLYLDAAKQLHDLPSEADLARLFQVDLIKPAPALTLGEEPIEEIKGALDLLQRMAGFPGDDRLSAFRQAFYRRYEEREVPLLEVLDEEVGIGFEKSATPLAEASPLLEGLPFPRLHRGNPSMSWEPAHTFMLSKLVDALENGQEEIVLNDEDLRWLPEKPQVTLPDSFAVVATVCAGSPDSLRDGHFRLLFTGSGGPSGCNVIARFCHFDDEMRQAIEQHLRQEEALQPDALFAEIVHLPEGRTGNILARPILRRYEIPYLTRSGADQEYTIPIDDLCVSLVGGPVAGRVVLRSARLDREIIPRLTTAHNVIHPNNTGIYRFLTALQLQGAEEEKPALGLQWDWGPLISSPFLPRVSRGRVVLSRAQWNVSATEIREVLEYEGASRYQAVQRLRRNRNLPQWVVVSDGDNKLAIDLDNTLCIETFLQLISNRPLVTLQEAFPSLNETCARGPEGRFTHEVIVPFIRQRKPSRTQFKPRPVRIGPRRRSFHAGSEWLYTKLYTGTSSADLVLREIVGPVMKHAAHEGLCDRWFFVRYADPDWHLRLRFHGDPRALTERLLPLLQSATASAIEQGLLWKVVYDRYERELERYGGSTGILIHEKISHIDSQAVLEIMDLIAGNGAADARWKLTFRGMDMLLDDLGFDVTTKLEVLQRCRAGFGLEFGADFSGLKVKLGQKYRSERKSLEQLLDRSRDDKSSLSQGLSILRQRSEKLVPLGLELRELLDSNRLSIPFTELAPSYLHMHANRMLRSAARAQELVLYDFLLRACRSKMARRQQRNLVADSTSRH